MFLLKAMGVGLCVALSTPALVMAQTLYAPISQVEQPALPDPLEFVVLNTSSLLGLPYERTRVQLEYAHAKGFVQYSLGADAALHDTLVHKLSQTYGVPLVNAHGQFEWRVRNALQYSTLSETITISIGRKMQQGYFVRADGRRERHIIRRSEPEKHQPLTSGHSTNARPQIRGPVDRSLVD